ncbi:hypothetical protein [Candidatus Albibeggiatoa sp. nov. NOAA]|uniref:hypothetical protein n=1 Tax=Candidatus Albibeggiatoa sp. nov. NOAA TaxID=3162724 RepID=UPI0032F2F4C5|nr:hypothetical protein [Thiotrichaceae bacterium]
MQFNKLSLIALMASLGLGATVCVKASPVGFNNVNDFQSGQFKVITFDPADEHSASAIAAKFNNINAVSISGGGATISNTYHPSHHHPYAGGSVSADGDYWIRWGFYGGSNVNLTFVNPVDSVGAFVGGDANGNASMTVTLTDGSTFTVTTSSVGLVNVPNSTSSYCNAINGFMGVDSNGGALIQSVLFSEYRDAASLDSIYFGAANAGQSGAGQTPMPTADAENCPNPPTFPSEDCLIYGVNDKDLNDSQLFVINATDGFTIDAFGEVNTGADIEALAISMDGTLFASSGDDTVQNGHLFTVNDDGSLASVGATGFGELSGLAFDPNGDLWGWADREGLISIDMTDGSASLVFDSDYRVEDIAWSNDGESLYAVAGTILYEYQPNSGNVTLKCNTFPSEVEAIDMLADGSLIFAVHENNDTSIHEFDIETCTTNIAIIVDTDYSDIEGIASTCN